MVYNYDDDEMYDDDEDFQEDAFWADFEYDFDGEDPLEDEWGADYSSGY